MSQSVQTHDDGDTQKTKQTRLYESESIPPDRTENTLGKVMENIITEIISYLTETHELLPSHHYGGCPGRSAEDAMMILSESIHRAWREKKIYTAIFMDVAGAFNNVHRKRLVNNLRKCRIPYKISSWITNFLQDRSTQFQFNGAKSGWIPDTSRRPTRIPIVIIIIHVLQCGFPRCSTTASSKGSGIHR